MKWPTGVSILSWALSGACVLIAGSCFSDSAKDSPSSIIMVSNDGQAERLDAVLPDNEIGLVVVEEGKKELELASNAGDNVADDESRQSEQSEQVESPSKTGAPPSKSSSKTASSKSGSSKKSGSGSKSSKPKPSESASKKKAAAPATASACVNINTADESALTTIKGIGPATAAKIIEYRAAKGPFRKKEDIQNVKGIGPATFAKIVDVICL